MIRAALLLLFSFCLLLSGVQASESPTVSKPFPIAVDQPAFIGEPIWVSETTRWPKYSDLGSDCIRLELLYDGKPVPPLPVKPVFPGGGSVGSRSIVNEIAAGCIRTGLYYPSPGRRLPLHIWFHIQKPGRYALRWTYVWSELKEGKRETKQDSSAWTTFTVHALSPEDREKWLRTLLDHPAANATDLAIDYIPSLVVAAPDERALHALVARLYSLNPLDLNPLDQVAAVAAEGLEFFPEERVRAAIDELIQKRGPTDFLAHLVSWNSLGLGANANQRAQMTRTCFNYLRSSDPEKAVAAIEMILFNVHGKNPIPTDPKLVAQADNEVLNAAADISEAGRADPQRELIVYMRCIKSPDGRGRLISMAHSGSAASDIANTALIYDHAPEANGPLLLDLWEHDASPHGISTAKSHGLTITNLTDSTVSIERLIAIERRTPKGWKQELAVEAVANCRDRRLNSNSPIHLAAHSSLAIRGWKGLLCAGQCEDACKQNAYVGPGIFRFVVALHPQGKRASLPFEVQRP